MIIRIWMILAIVVLPVAFALCGGYVCKRCNMPRVRQITFGAFFLLGVFGLIRGFTDHNAQTFEAGLKFCILWGGATLVAFTLPKTWKRRLGWLIVVLGILLFAAPR
jgi:uncharacterized membrane protein YgdD (TMEM256/DUF423 family)